MSIDLLNIARTGVMASQSQLGLTSNNITNANTAGYHRQVATQATLESQQLGGHFYGAGTYVSDVKRIYNDYAARELRIGQTGLGAAEASHSKLSELDQLFSVIGKAVPQGLNDFFSSINSLADLPADLGVRGGMLASAGQLADSLNQMQAQLDGQLTQTNDQIEGITKRVNEISQELGNINRELMKSSGQDMQLLDHQDALIQELSQYAEVNVIPLDTGAKTIMLGGAMTLVSGELAMTVGTKQGDPVPRETELTGTIGDKNVAIDPGKLGGQLQALFDFRDQTLVPASHEMGQLALGIADAFNSMQGQGMDLNGQVGQNIFRDINDPLMSSGRVSAYATTPATAANLSVNIDDTGALTGGAYDLSFDGANYQLTDVDSGAVTNLTLNGTVLEGGAGFSINLDSGVASLAAGNKFAIRPTAGAAGGIAVVMTDPKGIAAASPKINADAANSGNTQVKLVSIDNRNAANFPVTGNELTFTLDTVANTFTTLAADGSTSGPTAYTPPNISAFGFTFEVTSAGETGQSFSFDLSAAQGDNTNLVAMAKLSESKLMNGGASTLADVFQQTKLDVGNQTKAAEVKVGTANAIYQQAYARVESESGVNLDEEAANLMRFQQAYQASARIMTTASELFDTLFNSVR
ncbi:flagellar hook-associated protein FlgK [Shewanella sp. AS16]|uniref:flagellar hook-associated protein FlgK n=1 Tax=Shewanella sp. AS16 TaxID=2907625 RepID=UPI001F2F447F|nr:flagellar hook-associated protein FlgK [Shewanella sp. AS16]MCE9686682.1 flagellar hook-associated protein FlgK [Shewanella sp. AS16]